MRKKLYYFYNVILPDILLSILLILLFYILNFNVEVVSSRYVIFFGLIFSLLDLIFIMIINNIQSKILRKMTFKEIMFDKKNKFIAIILSFKLISILFMIFSLFISQTIFSNYIIINRFYLIIILAFIISIIKFILNKIFKFDTILIGDAEIKVQEKFDKLFEEINNKARESGIDENASEEEKIQKGLEKFVEELEKRQKELEEKKNDDINESKR